MADQGYDPEKLKGLKVEDIEKMLKDLTPPESERQFVIGFTCRTHGFRMENIASFKWTPCEDPECFHCNQFHEWIEKEAEKWLKKP